MIRAKTIKPTTILKKIRPVVRRVRGEATVVVAMRCDCKRNQCEGTIGLDGTTRVVPLYKPYSHKTVIPNPLKPSLRRGGGDRVPSKPDVGLLGWLRDRLCC